VVGEGAIRDIQNLAGSLGRGAQHFFGCSGKVSKLVNTGLFLVPDCDNKVRLGFFCGDESCYSVGLFNNDAGVFL